LDLSLIIIKLIDTMYRVRYSAVIPVYNEEQSIVLLHTSLVGVLAALQESYEVIFVDDGSSDRTLEVLKTLSPAKPKGRLQIISFAKRFGKSAALQAGFDAASGEIIITLDGDLQDDPAEIPRLLKKLDEGHDLVSGWRYRRQDPLDKKIASRVANRVRKLVTGEVIHDVGCSLRVFRRQVLNTIYLSKGWHRFFTAIVLKKGFRITELKVVHHRRSYGSSKYGIWDRLRESVFDLMEFRKHDWSLPMPRIQEYETKETIYR
jgi:glycosyltransferase involved in cell wall biosynthesis